MKHSTWNQCVSRETLERIAVFEALLERWNKHINLVSGHDMRQLRTRHIADSLSLLPLLPTNLPRAIDLGSGAGFPGLILAITSGVHFDLIEADHRKAAFLSEAARLTSAPVTIIADRVEYIPCSPAPVVTSRALAPLNALLSMAMPLLTNGGVCLFIKGRRVQDEIETARKMWNVEVIQHHSTTSPDGAILQVSNISRA